MLNIRSLPNPLRFYFNHSQLLIAAGKRASLAVGRGQLSGCAMGRELQRGRADGWRG